METIKGIVEKVIYYNDDNGYTVAILNLVYSEEDLKKKQKVITNSMTIVGNMDRLMVEDEKYELTGEYVDDPKFGLQFHFINFKRHAIESINGVINYLSSDLFPGVGKKTAQLIVDSLGIDAVSILKKDASKLDELNIDAKTKAVIVKGLHDNSSEELIIFLLNNGITMDMAHKIQKIFNEKTYADISSEEQIQEVKNNPYLLMDIVPNFGFKKADALAMNLGIAKSAMCRLKALFCYGLREVLYNSGNSYVEKNDLYTAMIKYIGENIEYNNYQEILDILASEHKIFIDEKELIYDYRNYIAEIELAKEIVLFLKDKRGDKKLKKYDSSVIDDKFAEILEEDDIEYSSEQVDAIKSAFSEPIVIVTGGPGTGKTTIVHAILKMYFKLNEDNASLVDSIALLAPTGRAAKRLKETTNMESSTIHRFLGYTGDDHYEYSKYNPTSAHLIIVDEASMMDLPLASRLITSMHKNARLIIVGDVDQLPSVGPGQVLKDLIDTNLIKTVRLTHIHRQAEGSSIIDLAHKVNSGQLPENLMEKLADRNFIFTTNEALPNMIADIYVKALGKGKTIKDIQILIPMYRGTSGINEINNLIQERINPLSDIGEIKHLGRIFRINDKVIQLNNRPEKGIMNGDIGYINNFIYKNDKISGLVVSYDLLNVSYEINDLEDITLAYAVSIHKAQGSEFDFVIMPMSNAYYIMLKRKLVYTGITRAKKSLLLIGQPNALITAIKRVEINRKTILKDKIIEIYNSFNKPTIMQILEEIDQKEQDLTETDEFSLGEKEYKL